jgi:serine protease
MAGLLTACGSTSPSYQSIIVNFVDRASPHEVAAVANKYHLQLQLNSASPYARTEELYQFHYDPQDQGAPRRLLKQLTAEKVVEYAEPNYLYSTTFEPNDQFFSQQWNFQAIAMPAAWDITAGENVTVAVIDTGVTQVSDLAATTFVEGYDFVDDDADASDLHGHGTHVAGTVAQSTNNGLGVAGIAYQASIMPIRVLDANGFGSVADIAEGIHFAADHGATVINMSLGGRMPTQLLEEAVRYAHDKGVTVVAAAGNENSDGASYPGRFPHVIGVSALGPTGEKAPYSNYGVGVDISAPGGAKTADHPEWGILQQTVNRRNPRQPEFAFFQGTSMASPHVAGVAALIQSQGITDPDEVEKVLKRSATPVADDKLNYFGAGRLNAQQALARASGQEQENPLMLWLKDFVQYLAQNGYLNPRFWLDGGAIALIPKLIMVIGGYILLVIIRWWLAPKRFGLSLPMLAGLVLGSSGLFVLPGLAITGFPRWPLQVLGSSLPEVGTALAQTSALNPIFASALIPLALVVFFLGHKQLRWLAIGVSLGMASHLLLAGTVFYEGVLWFGSAAWFGRSFLVLNGLVSLWLAYLAAQSSLPSQSNSTALTVR